MINLTVSVEWNESIVPLDYNWSFGGEQHVAAKGVLVQR